MRCVERGAQRERRPLAKSVFMHVVSSFHLCNSWVSHCNHETTKGFIVFFFEMERWNQCERLDELDAIISSNGWRSPAANEFSFSFNVAVFLRVRSEDLNVFFMDTGISVTASVRVHKTSCTFLIHVFVLFCIHLCARNLGYLVHLRD